MRKQMLAGGSESPTVLKTPLPQVPGTSHAGRCSDYRTGGGDVKGAETKHGPCFKSNG